jgi:transcriptional regulator with GAF, ATPase, and Fis domain
VRDITERIRKDRELKHAFREIKQLKDQLEEENLHLRKKIELEYRHDQIIGESDIIRQMLSLAENVARLDTCVLITRGTGTGKELLAHAIHNMSERKNRLMTKVNCAALPATLIESELFGREKGAFTGALSRRKRRINRPFFWTRSESCRWNCRQNSYGYCRRGISCGWAAPGRSPSMSA